MKKFFALLILALLFTGYQVFSQGASVTVFSAKGEKFTLEVNGTRQNSKPERKVYADGIGGPMVKMKVYLEDAPASPVSKSTMNKPNGNFIYVLEKDAKGKYVLQSSSTDWSADVKVEGEAEKPAAVAAAPAAAAKETEKKEKDTEKSAKESKGGKCESPIADADFYSSTAAISAAPFDPPKLSNAKKLSTSKCLSADQVRQVIYIFDGEKTKLDYAKFAYDYVFDPSNYDDVYDALREKSVTELKKYIESKK